MAYLNCGRCGLEIKVQAVFMGIESCPRCLAHSEIVTPMVLSAEGVRPAVGWGSPDDEARRPATAPPTGRAS